MFLPFIMIQYIMFSPRYCIKRNLITPNSIFIKLLSVCVMFALIFSVIHRNIVLPFYKDLDGTRLHGIVIYYDCLFSCSRFIIIFIVTVVQSKSNIQFILCFQKVHNFLNNVVEFKRYIVWNWISVVSVSCFMVVYLTAFYVYLELAFIWAYSWYFFIFFDINILYFIRVLKLLEDKVVLWNIQALQSLDGKRRGRFNHKELFKSYVDILETYNSNNRTFQIFVSNIFIISLILIYRRLYNV